MHQSVGQMPVAAGFFTGCEASFRLDRSAPVLHRGGLNKSLCMPAQRSPRQRLTALVLALTLVHLCLGFALGLSGDEAHYALYAAHLG